MSSKIIGASTRSLKVFKLAVSILSFGLAVFFAEIVLRQFVPLNTGTSAQYRIPHPVFGWILEPSAEYYNEMPETTVKVVYNSEGWRDVSHPINKPDGVFRILVLGDSFMEAYSVNLEESFPRLLEEFSRDSGRNIEVINMGVGGYGTLQEYLVFSRIGQYYSPDLVLLGFFLSNDVRNNSLELEEYVWGSESPKVSSRPFLEPNDEGGWEITQSDFSGAQFRYIAERQRLEMEAFRPINRFALLRSLRSVIKQTRAKLDLQSKSRDHQTGSAGQNHDLGFRGVYYCAEPPEWTTAWRTTERIIARLNTKVDEIGGQLVIFTVPALHEVSVEKMGEYQKDAAEPERLCLEEGCGYDRLVSLLGKHGVDLIDLLPEFRRASRKDERQLFRLSDKHWNADGHALATNLVLSELTKDEYLPSPE